jgi:hypothetical protein
MREIIGYRGWWIEGDQLKSYHQRFAWKPGVNIARCSSCTRAASRKDCPCGFWANYQPGRYGIYHPEAVGAILGTGQVQLKEKEFRVQHARVLCLAARYGRSSKVKRVADRLGVALLSPEELDQARYRRFKPPQFDEDLSLSFGGSM